MFLKSVLVWLLFTCEGSEDTAMGPAERLGSFWHDAPSDCKCAGKKFESSQSRLSYVHRLYKH